MSNSQKETLRAAEEAGRVYKERARLADESSAVLTMLIQRAHKSGVHKDDLAKATGLTWAEINERSDS